MTSAHRYLVRLGGVFLFAMWGATAFRPPRANAELVIGAWLIVVHDAETREAARAWAAAHCAEGALGDFCREPLNDGALGRLVGAYDARDWPGVEGGPALVAVGPVRSRREAAEIQAFLAADGLGARLVRVPALPRVEQWAADIAGRWRLWTVRGPATQQDVLYLSRDGSPDTELARGWPIPRETGHTELYAIGRESLEDASYYFFFAGAVQRVTPATGEQQLAILAGTDTEEAVRAAAVAHIGEEAPVHVRWALPFAAAATVDLGAGDGFYRRRFLLLRATAAGWRVTRDETQAGMMAGGAP